MVIDEVQRAPELFLAIKATVDADPRPGRFLLCPSASATRAILDRFDPAAIGAIMDVGNMAVEGYEDHRLAILRTRPQDGK